MIYEQFLGGVLCHYGVKGMKWGVRRTPEQLGHAPTTKKEESINLIDGVYHSSKGFTTDERKLSGYCLKPGAKHADDFFQVGYKESDAALLFQHLHQGFDMSKKRNASFDKSGAEKFSIPMKLGVDVKRTFNTAWRIDQPGDAPRFISAYRMDRLKEDE